ncbi:helicase IV [Rhizobium sp. Root491]|uniref:UvrD-helicase domain-containing protein n=1 Tax=Rhizobium sp. Root491 TaxID=1736548 RepID=UPI000715ADD8|nr:UvrD-helicase domain-containing protein [Rhizobium sp. Root491]KQY48637.1 helicase IV [Rhizobium sp. Root491]
MTSQWAPSKWTRIFSRPSDWTLTRDGMRLILNIDGVSHIADVTESLSLVVRNGLFSSTVTIKLEGLEPVKVRGLSKHAAASLRSGFADILEEIRIREETDLLLWTHVTLIEWLTKRRAAEHRADSARRWLTNEMLHSLEGKRPQLDTFKMLTLLRDPALRVRLGEKAAELDRDLREWASDLGETWRSLNARHSERELIECAEILDRVESRPLTPEQARAVICFDNRVQVVASAGSGKTSTMVARAAYAIYRGIATPDEIIMLAFNKPAAEELKERATRSFQRLGMNVSVEASTFHKLGLDIIGKATGKKPDIPDWAFDPVDGFRKLAELIDGLKDRSIAFRAQWDLFRFVCTRDLPKFGEAARPDAWDEQGNGSILTADGTRVRSQEEALISNWLFYNGVNYRYEHAYVHDTADASHRQYKPDFFYPDIDLYHEHFALDARGNAPSHFGDYVAGVEWKRQLHAERGTALIETTSHQVRTGTVLDHLEKELTGRGVVLDPNPDRPIPENGLRPMPSEELIGLVRTFISHYKSNGLTPEELAERVDRLPADAFKHRYRMFASLAVQIIKAWDEALAAVGGIDFEDMLNMAAEYIENGTLEEPYRLVMADEFQDASRARARLCRALVQKKDRYFFAVGDDWQSINRFAGADISVMTGFQDWFGHGQILKLERTFRCPQALCDVSSQFVSKNPSQITKKVHSTTPAAGPVLEAYQVEQLEQLPDAVRHYVERLAKGVENGTITPGRNGKISVYVLGRYNADQQHVPRLSREAIRWVDVSFLTIHRSKGSEADYVILPEMLTTLRGRSFPSTRADDPVLGLAMPPGDHYPASEERRLFYVALTRARRTVAMFTAQGKNSSFLKELEADGAVTIQTSYGQPIQEEPCPACRQGAIILKTGRHGPFRSCSNFPICRYKPKKKGGSRTGTKS